MTNKRIPRKLKKRIIKHEQMLCNMFRAFISHKMFKIDSNDKVFVKYKPDSNGTIHFLDNPLKKKESNTMSLTEVKQQMFDMVFNNKPILTPYIPLMVTPMNYEIKST